MEGNTVSLRSKIFLHRKSGSQRQAIRAESSLVLSSGSFLRMTLLQTYLCPCTASGYTLHTPRTQTTLFLQMSLRQTVGMVGCSTDSNLYPSRQALFQKISCASFMKWSALHSLVASQLLGPALRGFSYFPHP